MLFNLSNKGQAPAKFGKLNKANVPKTAILASVACMLIGVVLNYIAPGKAFTYVTSVGTFGGLFSWFMIVYTHMKFRKQLTGEQIKKLKFPGVFYPASNYITLVFLVGVFISMLVGADTRLPAIIGVAWIALLIVAYNLTGLNKKSAANSAADKKAV